MSRQGRIQSSLGIYHVMLRGINKQNIFFCEEDYVRMMTILQEAPIEVDPSTGKAVSDNLCTIYAYCILDNHLPLIKSNNNMPNDNNNIQLTTDLRQAVGFIKQAIQRSQARALQSVNNEVLSLYYGIGRYVSENSRHNM